MKKIFEKKWHILTFVCLTLIYILLNKDIIFKTYLHAEDGLFLYDALENGIGSLFAKNGGYFVLISRLAALIGITLGKTFSSIVVAANTIEVVAIIFAVISINYFNTTEFEWLVKNKYIRFLISLVLMIFLTNFHWMTYNCVAIHWWGGALIFLISLNLINNKLPTYSIIPFAILSILSSASVMPLGIAIVYYLFKQIDFKKNIKKSLRKLTKEQIIKILLLFIPLVIEGLSILINDNGISTSSSSLNFSNLTQMFSRIFELILLGPAYILGIVSFETLTNLKLIEIVSMIIWCIIFYLALKQKKLKNLMFIIIYVFILYFMTLFKDINATNYGYQTYYRSLPSFILCFTLLTLVFNEMKKEKIYVYCLALVFFGYINYKNMYPVDFGFSNGLEQVDKYVDFRSSNYAYIPISPYEPWTIKVPVNDKYCEEFSCED